MSFTYSDALTLDKDKVRFAIGDTVSGAGPKLDGLNFSDGEIAGLLAAEGVWQRAVAAAFETLAAVWARDIASLSINAQGVQANISSRYADLAATWRKKYGGAAGVSSSGSSPTIRADGYSSDLDNITVESW